MPTDPLHTRFESLPHPPLPPELWPRLAQRRQRQLATRRAGTALALALLVVGPLGLMWRAQQAPSWPSTLPAAGVTGMAAQGAESNTVSVIDHALQNAYARGASDEEIAPLWEARRRLAGNHHASAPTDPS